MNSVVCTADKPWVVMWFIWQHKK